MQTIMTMIILEITKNSNSKVVSKQSSLAVASSLAVGVVLCSVDQQHKHNKSSAKHMIRAQQPLGRNLQCQASCIPPNTLPTQ